MTVSRRTYFCPLCRKFTRLSLPTEIRSCEHCKASLIPPYAEDDFKDTDDPEVIRRWVALTKTRHFGLRR